MRSLGVRLALAFAAVIAVGVGGVAVLVGRETTNEFRTYVERGRSLYVERMAAGLTHYYGSRGDWAGVDALLQGWLRGPVDRLAVADTGGTLVADTGSRGAGESATELGAGRPLLLDGRQVGTLYVGLASAPFGRNP